MLALATLLAFFGMTYGQNFTTVAAFKNKFLGCVSADSRFQYCSSGDCYNGTAPSSLTCTKDFDSNYSNPIFPATYTYEKTIDSLDIIDLPLVSSNKSTWAVLNRGETMRFTFRSQTEKSAYVELLYNPLNGGSDNTNKTINQQVQFLVFNNRLKDIRKFDVSKVDKVLLPNSADDFTVYLAARGSNFNITVVASDSVVSRVFSVAVACFAMLALMF